MQSLLRTRPENLDDLTVQVALVRPGPIQGKAVHPYIERRQRLRDDPSFVYPVEHESLREPLRETLGVVVFQDQVLDVAMAAARFSVGEAEGLRRAMSRKRSEEAIEAFRPRFVEGCLGNGIDEPTAHTIYDKLVGFSGFGFPKSHAAAFGLLAYQSAWLRRYYPAEFLCSLLNAQPMGFYPPASLVRDAQRRGVEVRPPHVNLQRCPLHRRGPARSGSASATSARSARARPRRSPPSSRSPTSATSPGAARPGKDALEALVASGACDELGAEARAALAPRRDAARRERRRRHPPARAPARADRRDPRAPPADRLGADARRLPPHLDLGRPPPAGAPPPAPRRRPALQATSSPGSRTARGSPSPASPSPASAPRPPRASSSCCSRTSTAR